MFVLGQRDRSPADGNVYASIGTHQCPLDQGSLVRGSRRASKPCPDAMIQSGIGICLVGYILLKNPCQPRSESSQLRSRAD